MSDLGQAKDLSYLTQTGSEKVETGAIEFIAETRQVIVAMAHQIDYLTQAVAFLLDEVKKLKGESTHDDKTATTAQTETTGHAENRPDSSDSSGSPSNNDAKTSGVRETDGNGPGNKQ